MKQVTIRTPFFVNLCFHILLIAPIIVAFALYGVIDASATTYKVDCRTEFEQGFFERIEPSVQKAC